MKTIHRSDLGVGIGLVALSLILYFVLIPQGISEPSKLSSIAMSPRFWPSVIAAMLGLAGLVVIVQQLASRSRLGAATLASPEEHEDPTGAKGRWIKAIACMVWSFVYYASIPYVGVVAASFATLLFLTWMGGERRIVLMLLLAVLLPSLLYYFFNYVAHVSLPLGIFESLR